MYIEIYKIYPILTVRERIWILGFLLAMCFLIALITSFAYLFKHNHIDQYRPFINITISKCPFIRMNLEDRVVNLLYKNHTNISYANSIHITKMGLHSPNMDYH